MIIRMNRFGEKEMVNINMNRDSYIRNIKGISDNIIKSESFN